MRWTWLVLVAACSSAPAGATDAGGALACADAAMEPLACGPLLTCNARTEFCAETSGTDIRCEPLPAACCSSLTCACVRDNATPPTSTKVVTCTDGTPDAAGSGVTVGYGPS